MSHRPEQSIGYSPIESEQKRMPTGEEIWNGISTDVRTEIEGLYQEYKYAPEFTDAAERQEEIEVLVGREREFVIRLWDELVKFCTNNPNTINLLLDIDETLGRFKPDETGNDGHTVLRPAVVRLLNRLAQEYDEKLRMGFITTRGEDRLGSQLDDPRHLQPIRHVINRSILFSTQDLTKKINVDNDEDWAFYEATRDGAQVATTAEYCQNIIDPERLAKEAEDEYRGLFRNTGDKLKTSLLARLVREHPDQAYMAVDDFPYPSILKKDDPRIRGVWLDQEAAFYL